MYKKLKIIIPIFMLAVFGLIQFTGIFTVLDNVIYDNLLSSKREPSKDIVIVGIDDRSINEIGKWPWPRFYIADAISKLVDMDAAVIGANLLYDAYGADEGNDAALVAAAAKSDRLVLAEQYVLDSDTQNEFIVEDYIGPFTELSEVTKTGFINVSQDTDGVLRKTLNQLKYGDITVYSLPMQVYLTYCETAGIAVNEDIPLDRLGRFPINYVGEPGKYTQLSLWDLVNDVYPSEMFKEKIVLIGPYAQGIGDKSFSTPFDRHASTYGVEINANIVQNLIDGSFKQEVDWYIDFAVMALLGIILIIFLYRLKPVTALIVTILLAAAQLAGAKLMYMQFDYIIHGGICVIFLFICYLVNLVLSILSTQNEKQHIQGLFGRFVSPDVVREIISGGVSVELGGVERDLTVLFVDIRGFTAFSEANPAEKVVGMVNRYLNLTSHSIQEFGGTIDKYIGDATMAVFNAPLDLPDHPLCAVRAAWAMKQGSVALREEILKDYGVDLQFGIGVNTGRAVVGNMGSDLRMDYTAIGDTVNTSARLEANAQKGQILLSDATYQLVKDHVEVTDLGILNVKNKKIGIQIYNLDNMLD